jgi:hypothetical protein
MILYYWVVQNSRRTTNGHKVLWHICYLRYTERDIQIRTIGDEYALNAANRMVAAGGSGCAGGVWDSIHA